MSSYYEPAELEELGLAEVGQDVRISRKASIYSPEKITIGDNVRIDDFCFISGDVTIGSHVHLGLYSSFAGGAGIEINDFVDISPGASLFSVTADYLGQGLTNPTIPERFRVSQKEKISLGEHTAVGSHSIVLPGTCIKDGGVVGALSLVRNKTIPPWEIYFGIPARKIDERDSEPIRSAESEFLKYYED